MLARINARQSWRETEIETITGITYGEATILARILDNCPTYDPDLEGSPSGIAYLEGSPSGIAYQSWMGFLDWYEQKHLEISYEYTCVVRKKVQKEKKSCL